MMPDEALDNCCTRMGLKNGSFLKRPILRLVVPNYLGSTLGWRGLLPGVRVMRRIPLEGCSTFVSARSRTQDEL